MNSKTSATLAQVSCISVVPKRDSKSTPPAPASLVLVPERDQSHELKKLISGYIAVLQDPVKKTNSNLLQRHRHKCAIPLKGYMTALLPNLHKPKIVAEDLD